MVRQFKQRINWTAHHLTMIKVDKPAQPLSSFTHCTRGLRVHCTHCVYFYMDSTEVRTQIEISTLSCPAYFQPLVLSIRCQYLRNTWALSFTSDLWNQMCAAARDRLPEGEFFCTDNYVQNSPWIILKKPQWVIHFGWKRYKFSPPFVGKCPGNPHETGPPRIKQLKI